MKQTNFLQENKIIKAKLFLFWLPEHHPNQNYLIYNHLI